MERFQSQAHLLPILVHLLPTRLRNSLKSLSLNRLLTRAAQLAAFKLKCAHEVCKDRLESGKLIGAALEL